MPQSQSSNPCAKNKNSSSVSLFYIFSIKGPHQQASSNWQWVRPLKNAH
uniref:Uncharacterized protein n=1 Tax=Manihot esculenta TaxID=3983 RepID=A0A2C9U060_MANES